MNNEVLDIDTPDAITKRQTLEREIMAMRLRVAKAAAAHKQTLTQLETVERSHEVNVRNLRDVEYLLGLMEAEIVRLGGKVPAEPQPNRAQNIRAVDAANPFADFFQQEDHRMRWEIEQRRLVQMYGQGQLGSGTWTSNGTAAPAGTGVLGTLPYAGYNGI